MSKKILITGGAGYIGAHTCVELLRNGYEVMIFDDLSNSSEEVVNRIELLADSKFNMIIGDIRNGCELNDAMSFFKPDCVIHLAGLKAVGESVTLPIPYYDVNVSGSINLLKSMKSNGCHKIVFSSSATVYGDINLPPFKEEMPANPLSPYGRTKLIIENMLQDWVSSDTQNHAIVLRYFNPVGADESGLIGENPRNIPNNLMPLITRVAQMKQSYLSVYGSDYATRDGTAERDYIHVSDLAYGHLKAVQNLRELESFQIINLGTGKTTSVIELVKMFETVNKTNVPFRVVERRLGDVAVSYADNALAKDLLDFKCMRTLEDMCRDSWNWTQRNSLSHA